MSKSIGSKDSSTSDNEDASKRKCQEDMEEVDAEVKLEKKTKIN